MIVRCEVVPMTIRYPNGKKYVPVQATERQKIRNLSFSNRGKTLEDELNESNEYYLSRDIAVIHKKPVPIQIVKVSYPSRSAARHYRSLLSEHLQQRTLTAFGKVIISILKQKKQKAKHHFHYKIFTNIKLNI